MYLIFLLFYFLYNSPLFYLNRSSELSQQISISLSVGKTLNKVNIFRVIGTKVRESKAVRCKRCKLAFDNPSFKNRQIEFDKDDRRSLTVKTITFSGWLLREQYKNVVKNRIIEVKMAPCRVFFPVSDPTKKLTETHWTMYGNKKKLLFIGGEVVPHDSQTNVEIMRYIKINCSFRWLYINFHYYKLENNTKCL